jgi:hypothetical protein
MPLERDDRQGIVDFARQREVFLDLVSSDGEFLELLTHCVDEVINRDQADEPGGRRAQPCAQGRRPTKDRERPAGHVTGNQAGGNPVLVTEPFGGFRVDEDC